MDTYDKNLNACLLHRNKQLTRQLKDYQQTLALTDCSSSLMLAMGQLLRLHRLPSYGLVTSEEEWCHLFAVIDMFYGGCLSADLYNPQIQISAESETKRSIFRKRDKTKRSKKESAQHSKSRNKSFVMTSVSAL